MTTIAVIGLSIGIAATLVIASKFYTRDNEESNPFLFAMAGAILLITGLGLLTSPLQSPNGQIEVVDNLTTTITPTYTTNTFISTPIAVTLIVVAMFALVDAIPRMRFKKEREDRLDFD